MFAARDLHLRNLFWVGKEFIIASAFMLFVSEDTKIKAWNLFLAQC